MIANPRSSDGRTARRWVRIERQLRDALGLLEVEFTRGPHDAERIAREGVRAGVERVVVAGGDGTLSEVVHGLLSADLGGYAQIGVLPLGTGGDFARSISAPEDIEAAIEQLGDGAARTVDAGRVTYGATDGRQVQRYFANVASFGLGGFVAEWVNRRSRLRANRALFPIGAVYGLLRYEPEPVAICVDGELVFEGPLVLAAAANGRFFGGGMQVAPHAELDDGQLEWVVVPELADHPLLSTLRLYGKIGPLYRGAHLSDSRILHGRGRSIEASGTGDRVKIEGDGELLGALPARVEVVPGAIALFGLPK